MQAQKQSQPAHRKPFRVIRRWMTAAAVAIPLAALAVASMEVAERNRTRALAAEKTLQVQWRRDLANGMPPQAVDRLQSQLQAIQSRDAWIPARWLAPWNGYDLALKGLSGQTAAAFQSATDDARAKAQLAWQRWVKLQRAWGLEPDGKGAAVKLAASGTPNGLEALADQWAKAAGDFERQTAELKRESGGFQQGRPADIVAEEGRLEGKLAHPNGASGTVITAAQQALADTKQYLAAPPAQELADHRHVQTELQRAIVQFPVPVPAATDPDALAKQIASYLAHRESQLSVAVFNANTGKTFSWQPALTFCTASIVKATIMADLLRHAQANGQPLPAWVQQEMVPMIEYSDNNAASQLWQAAGEAQGIEGFLQTAGMDHTAPGQGGYWGLTQTTAQDQLQLMKLFAYPNAVLDSQSRAYGLNLMEHITSWEDWGVSAGPPPGTTVALKNGWSPTSSDGWRINSIGYVDGDGRNYAIAILSQGNPTEQDGISTVQQISEYVWQAMGS